MKLICEICWNLHLGCIVFFLVSCRGERMENVLNSWHAWWLWKYKARCTFISTARGMMLVVMINEFLVGGRSVRFNFWDFLIYPFIISFVWLSHGCCSEIYSSIKWSTGSSLDDLTINWGKIEWLCSEAIKVLLWKTVGVGYMFDIICLK